MKTFIYSISIFLLSISTATAQKTTDAQTIINELLSNINTSAISTDFELITSEKNSVNSQSNQGAFTMKAKQFVLEMPEVKVWFDGKTQWTFATQSNEVSITEPTDEEIAQINPLVILNKSANEMNISFSKKISDKNHIIYMTPKTAQNSMNSVSKVELQINKKTEQISSLEMTEKDGTRMLLKFKNYKKDVKLSKDFFKFDKAPYKDAFINDLR